MKRPMWTLGLALALTTWAAFLFPARQSLLLSAAAAATGLLAAALRRPRLRALCAACFVAAVALALHALHEARRVEPFLRAEGETVAFEGLVTEAQIAGRSARYRVEAAFPGTGLPDAPLALRAYGEMDFVPGDAIRGDVLLTPPPQPERGLRLSGDQVAAGVLQGAGERLPERDSLNRRVIALRERLRRNVYAHLHPTSADIVSAMVLGMTDNVGADVYAAVNRAGTVHLLSVSGLHLSILTALCLGILSRLGVPRRARALAAIGLALGFSLLVGFSAPIVRSFTMTAIALAAGLGRRRSDSRSSLGFAVAVICLAWPGWVLGKGFWLSAGSTLGILLYADKLTAFLYERLRGRGRLYNKLVRAVAAAGAVSVAAYAFTLPLLVLFNGWISLVAPLANILVAPFVPVVIAGGILCALVSGTAAPIRLAAQATDLCTAAVLRVSQLLGDLPFATAAVDEGWMVAWMALLLGVAAVLTLAGGIRRTGGESRRMAAYGLTLAALCFAVGTLTQAVANRNTVELATIADCDTAVLIRQDEAVVLGTPTYYEIDRLLRYLEFRGVGHIRAVVAHDCGEQIGSGLLRLAARYPVDCVLGPNDAYILGQLAEALPEIPVYSGGYATLTALGTEIEIRVPEGDVRLAAGNNFVLKSVAKYGIIEGMDFANIRYYPEGVTVLDGARGLEPTPVGTMLYGEQRFRLTLR